MGFSSWRKLEKTVPPVDWGRMPAKSKQKQYLKIRITEVTMIHSTLRGTTALVLLAAFSGTAFAQDTATTDAGYLGTLTLTGSKRDIATGSAAARTVIDEEEIKDRQGSTVAQLIDSVPGVTLVNGVTPTGSGINIRGFGANSTYGTDQKVAIMIDDATTGSEELYRVGTQLFTDPYLYRSVEVLRGTIGSFEYGSGIVGGVVKLETIDASDMTGGEPGLKVRQTFDYGSNGNSWTSSTTFAYQPSDRAEFLLNYTYRDQDDLNDGSGEEIGNSAFSAPSYLAKGKFYLDEAKEHSLSFSYTQTSSEDNDVPYDQFGTATDAFGNVDRTTTTKTATVSYNYNPSGNDLVDATATLSYADQEIDSSYVTGSSYLEAYYPSIAALGDADHRYQTTKLTLKNNAYFETGIVQNELRAGVEFIHKDRADQTSAPGGVDDRIAVFAVNEMSIGNFTLTPALRFERSQINPYDESSYDEYDNSGWMGGLALAYEFDSGFAVFGSWAHTKSLPILDDLGSSDYMEQPELSETIEIGASYAGTDVFGAGDNLAIRGNVYQTKLWDVTSYSGVDSVAVFGVELEASYAVSSGYYVELNATAADGFAWDSDGVVEDFERAPANRYNMTVGKKFDDFLDVSWEYVVSTNQYDSSGDELDDARVHNVRATIRPESGVLEGTEIRLGLENVFDVEYQTHLSSSSRYQPGQNLKLTVSTLF